MGIAGIHAIPMMIKCMLQEHFATQGFPALSMGKTFAVYCHKIIQNVLASAANFFIFWEINPKSISRKRKTNQTNNNWKLEHCRLF